MFSLKQTHKTQNKNNDKQSITNQTNKQLTDKQTTNNNTHKQHTHNHKTPKHTNNNTTNHILFKNKNKMKTNQTSTIYIYIQSANICIYMNIDNAKTDTQQNQRTTTIKQLYIFTDQTANKTNHFLFLNT